MNNTNTPRSHALLNKMYDHLDTIDVSNLSMSEMKDFLEVVRAGQFLESYGQMPSMGFGGFGGFGSTSKPYSADVEITCDTNAK